MLKTEYWGQVDGMTLHRTYSDEDMMIRQDETGELYEEAVDPDFMGRTYTETDIPIYQPEEDTDSPPEITDPPEEWPEPEEGGEALEELGVPEEVMEDAEPEDPDGPLPISEELV